MDRDRNKRASVSTMQRIAATLDALASLAVRLGTVPPVLRLLVLWAFRHGEAAARAFVIEAALAFGQLFLLPAPAAAESFHDSVAEAARLAASFRALARALCAIADAESRASASGGRRGGTNPAAHCLGRLHRFRALLHALHGPVRAAGHSIAAPDTS